MWPNPKFSADLVILTEEIFYGKLHFLCIEVSLVFMVQSFQGIENEMVELGYFYDKRTICFSFFKVLLFHLQIHYW